MNFISKISVDFKLIVSNINTVLINGIFLVLIIKINNKFYLDVILNDNIKSHEETI